MITLKYRLVGSVSNPTITKQFDSRELCMDWVKLQGNIFIIEIEYKGTHAYQRLYG